MNEFDEFLECIYTAFWASQAVLVLKNPSANAGDVGSVPGLGRSPGGGHGDPFQYSCLENTMYRGAWRAAVHRLAKSRTRLSDLWCTQLIYSLIY